MKLDSIKIDVSPGELIDKITILQIKADKIQDISKLENVNKELELLTNSLHEGVKITNELRLIMDELQQVNETLWAIEDKIRLHEASRTFDTDFIELARAVYKENDKRANLKRKINNTLGSGLIEEKSYSAY
ncbi:MAG: hypothetical protein CFH08_02163 [Alphaproteobacteria bacterium MarineAlpha3_Bin7]|nr:MAG: hypothetical protein CFH08_02163 [Alphaproteobacteria bacterium MarineAlpha3_Bin7]|tara:strand:- start:533 stop:928 length:396 start_codon:yes stop_codon:yes gene_type:complete